MSNAVMGLAPVIERVLRAPAAWAPPLGPLREGRTFRALTTHLLDVRHRFPHRVARSNRALAGLVKLPITVAGVVAIAVLLRGRYLRWGATDEERTRAISGDEILPAADQSATRAIAIAAAADRVWPWIAQLGQGKGGFYSYDWLENLVANIDIHNADQIVPEWQHLVVGSEVRLAPELPLQVAILDVGRALVLRGNVPMGQDAPPYDFTWAFVLQPQPDGTTRLVVRERYAYSHRWAALIVQPAQLVSCFMSPEMLRGIKTRAERPLPAVNGTTQRPPPLTADRPVRTPTGSI
ncbi:MAG: hypothetical protein ABI137_08625 [Antricoccus sp.]